MAARSALSTTMRCAHPAGRRGRAFGGGRESGGCASGYKAKFILQKMRARRFGNEEDDDLDWEPEDEEDMVRRRGTLQLQRPPVSTSYGRGGESAQRRRRRRRLYGDEMEPEPGVFSAEALRTEGGRRTALFTALAGASTFAVVSSGLRVVSAFDSNTLNEEVDLMVTPKGLLVAKSPDGQVYEFFNDGDGGGIVVASVGGGSNGAVFSLDDEGGGDATNYLELVSRAGRIVLVPQEYVRMLCESSRKMTKKTMRENQGNVELRPAPPELARYEDHLGFAAPDGYKMDPDIRLMHFGGILR